MDTRPMGRSEVRKWPAHAPQAPDLLLPLPLSPQTRELTSKLLRHFSQRALALSSQCRPRTSCPLSMDATGRPPYLTHFRTGEERTRGEPPHSMKTHSYTDPQENVTSRLSTSVASPFPAASATLPWKPAPSQLPLQ